MSYIERCRALGVDPDLAKHLFDINSLEEKQNTKQKIVAHLNKLLLRKR